MRLLYIILCATMLFSCKKGSSNFTIKGTITDTTFNQALSGATLSLYQVPSGTNNSVLISSTTVAADGSYSFTFKRDKMDKYILTVAKNNYFSLSETITFSSLSIEEDNVRNYSTTAMAWVKLHFFNLNPSDLDELDYTKQQGKQTCSGCCPTTEQHLYGAIDTSIYCINDANTVYSYLYSVYGTTDQGIMSVTTTAFDTTELYLSY